MTETAGEMSPPRKKKRTLTACVLFDSASISQTFSQPLKKNNNKMEWRVVHELGDIGGHKHLMQVGTARFKDAHMHFTASRLKKKSPRAKKKRRPLNKQNVIFDWKHRATSSTSCSFRLVSHDSFHSLVSSFKHIEHCAFWGHGAS